MRSLLIVTAAKQPRLFGLLQGRGVQISVTLPPAWHETMARDGLEEKPPRGQKLGEKAWWFRQMLGVVPPSFWSRHLNVQARTLVDGASESEWKDLLHDGWAAATLAHPDTGWAEALLAVVPRRSDLLLLLSPEHREAIVLQTLQGTRGPLPGNHPAIDLWPACQHPWSAQMTRACLEKVRQRIPAGSSQSLANYQLHAVLRQAARHVPPALLKEAASGWPTEAKDWGQWQSTVDQFLAVVQFRYDMLKEIAE
jgi:hypothetical protein